MVDILLYLRTIKEKTIDMKNFHINGHGHVLPGPDQIPDSIKKAGYFDLVPSLNDPKQLMMTQKFKDWSRPVTDNTFFAEAQVEWMSKWNIDHTIVITLSQLYCNGLPENITYDIISFQNDFQLQLQELYPSKFTCGFVVQPLYLDHALREIEKRHKEGLSFLCLPTNYKDSEGGWTTSTDESCQEIYSLANDLGLAVQLHPYDYEDIIMLKNRHRRWPGHILSMPYLSAELWQEFIYEEIDLACPRARFAFSHGNMFSFATIGRKTHGYYGRPDLYRGCNRAPGYALNATNMFYDSIVHDFKSIDFMMDKISHKQIIAGYDTPYPLGEVDGVKDSIYPGVTLDGAESLGYINSSQKVDIKGKNVSSWLYGDNYQAIEDFYKRIKS